MKLSVQTIDKIQLHVVSEFPNEACGLIVDGNYIPCLNIAEDPLKDFKIASEIQMQLKSLGKTISAVVHSHPNGPYFPSEADMISQISLNIPFMIFVTDGERVSMPEMWGNALPRAPLIGREFMHGIRDCFSLMRDAFILGAEKMKSSEICGLTNEGIEWPFEPILLDDFARDDGWWGHEGKPGKDLYVDNFKKMGFKKITAEEAKIGDVFLCKIKSDRLNHGGVLIGNDLLMHHLPNRLSCRAPAGTWARVANMWIRYEGKNAA